MYPHSDGGYRQFPGLVEFAQYVDPVTNNDATTVINAQVTSPLSFTYNHNGTKFYVLDTSGVLYQYSCSTAYGPPTSYDSESLDLTGTDSAPVSVVWRAGLSNTFYMLGATGGAYFAFNTGTDASALSTYSYAGVSQTVPSIAGTLKDFYTTDGKNWLFNTTSKAYHHTSGNWETALTKQSETAGTSDVRSFDSTGKVFYRVGGGAYRTQTAYDVSALYEIGPSGFTDGLPVGLKYPIVYKYVNDTTMACVFVNSSTSYFASWTMTDGQIVDGGSFRGAEVMGGVPYAILGNSLMSFDSSGKFAAHEYDITGAETIVSDTDGTNFVFVTGSEEYRFRLSDGVTTITDSDVTGAVSTAYLDSTFYYPVADQLFASDLADPTSIGSLNFISAESFTDSIIRNFTLNQLHYSFGAETTEVHFTSGQGNTRLSRQTVLEHGIIGKHAIDSIDDTIYFLDAERRLSMIRGLQYAPINISGLGREFDSYSTVSDCIINAYTFEQQNFIEITFPTEDVTWTVHELSGEIVKREDSSGNRARSANYLKAYGKTFAVDHSNNKIYELSGTTYQEDGNAMTRTLYSDKITSETFEMSAREFSLNVIYLGYDTSGSSDITVSVSNDSGATFTNSKTITVNGRGIERLTPLWGQAVEFILKIETSSNQKVDILNLAVEPEAVDD